MTSVSFAPAVFTHHRISLAEIDAVVSARLGETRGLGKLATRVFQSASCNVPGQACRSLEHHYDWTFLQRS